MFSLVGQPESLLLSAILVHYANQVATQFQRHAMGYLNHPLLFPVDSDDKHVQCSPIAHRSSHVPSPKCQFILQRIRPTTLMAKTSNFCELQSDKFLEHTIVPNAPAFFFTPQQLHHFTTPLSSIAPFRDV